ncbi:MAG: AraC family transcriptional regulator [bacterium]|nr:AraC family transcriptional regulator [bacterium]MDD4152218.1 AraC family transcriptional regulator [bacterium]
MLQLADINPVVRSAGKMAFKPGYDGSIKSVPLTDHDLHLAYRGRGALVIDGCRYAMEVGDVVTVFPGESFHVEVEGDRPFSRYFIHFDFVKDEDGRLLSPVLEQKTSWPRHVRLMYDGRARDLCADIVLRSQNNGAAGGTSRIIIAGHMQALLGIVAENYTGKYTDEGDAYSKCRKNILQSERFIHANYRNNLTVAEIAGAVGLSADYFGRAFKALFGRTPLDYLTSHRLREAKRLMVETDLSIGEIARQAGYDDIHYFSYIFKHREGITPSQFISKLTIEE